MGGKNRRFIHNCDASKENLAPWRDDVEQERVIHLLR